MLSRNDIFFMEPNQRWANPQQDENGEWRVRYGTPLSGLIWISTMAPSGLEYRGDFNLVELLVAMCEPKLSVHTLKQYERGRDALYQAMPHDEVVKAEMKAAELHTEKKARQEQATTDSEAKIPWYMDPSIPVPPPRPPMSAQMRERLRRDFNREVFQGLSPRW